MIIGLEWAFGRSTWMFGEDLGRGSSTRIFDETPTAALSFTLLPSALITRLFSPLCRAIVSRDTAASMRSQLHNEYRRFTTSPPPQPGPVSMDCCPGDYQLPASFLSSGSIDSFLSREFIELRFPPGGQPRRYAPIHKFAKWRTPGSHCLDFYRFVPRRFEFIPVLCMAICYVPGCRSLVETEKVEWSSGEYCFFVLVFERDVF